MQVGAWLLYDTAEGRRRLVCVPLSFKPGEVSAGALLGGGWRDWLRAVLGLVQLLCLHLHLDRC